MLVSAALVLMMSGPGLALFYGGLVRKKNILGTMMQTFAMMAVITVLWALVTYSLAFGEGNAFIGGLHNVFLHGVGLAPDPKYAATIPLQTFMVYQLMFAIITPALITGAFAERMKFSAMLVFMVLWALFVYSPMAHMVWGKGGLLNAALGGRFPTLDFAGGTVVHVTSGVSALVTALYLGKRLGYPKVPMPPHSVVLSFIGACLLWVGWFGFNAGSALSCGDAGDVGVCGDALWRGGCGDWLERGGVDSAGQAFGAGCDLGLRGGAGGDYAGGGICDADVGAVDWADRRCVLLLHGGEGEGVRLGMTTRWMRLACMARAGRWERLLTGIFANSVINPIFGAGKATGLLEGNAHQLLNQLVGVAIAWSLSIVGTLIILFVVDKLIGLRVSEEDEREGLDLSQHGEEGYDWAH